MMRDRVVLQPDIISEPRIGSMQAWALRGMIGRQSVGGSAQQFAKYKLGKIGEHDDVRGVDVASMIARASTDAGALGWKCGEQ